MAINVTVLDTHVVFAPQGRIDSNNAAEAESTIIGNIDGGAERVVFDFGQLDYISSAGLRVILVAAKKIKAKRGKLAICSMKASIREVFEMSGFLSILTVCDTPEAAQAAVV
ncbi:STAS domain-containing protein [Telmatospirillum sp. J64-1]|uniref:STAS domain-containing protein n=1 Tax=Telmatospirillum sp. J64-1 TaxID=2502183 RepID=UPI00115EC36F|nr:STAS domain-containing protein [Telmatospirillum sp. J64-1]